MAIDRAPSRNLTRLRSRKLLVLCVLLALAGLRLKPADVAHFTFPHSSIQSSIHAKRLPFEVSRVEFSIPTVRLELPQLVIFCGLRGTEVEPTPSGSKVSIRDRAPPAA